MDQPSNAAMPPTYNPSPPPPTQTVRKSMPLWKRIFIIVVGTVCLFGIQDTLFPSKPATTTNQSSNKTPTPTSSAPITWKPYTNDTYHYFLSYPDNLQISQKSPESILFEPGQKQASTSGFPALYISVIPAGSSSATAQIYNVMPEAQITSFYTMKDNESKQIATGTYKKLATLQVAQVAGVMIQNDNVPHGSTGLHERRILVKKNGLTYILGSYYQNQAGLTDFYNFYLHFIFLP